MKTVIITGGTKGLGREIALAFGRANYFVFVFFASDEAAAENMRSVFAAEKISGCVVRHDVTAENPAIWQRVEILEAQNLTLIHAACAPFLPVPLHQLRWPDFQNNFDVAVKGGWRCAQNLIRPMLKQGGGTIVNVLTSAIEALPPKGFCAYAVAKHALRGLTLSLAAEYGSRGVRVFSVSPGFMHTSLTEKWDVRLREAIQAAARNSEPPVAAKRIMELVENKTVAGNGEDHQI
jgi:NAD(P)-dependent dehydrogenase (short-subunit alcohol dehydrogenase family)